ncbi:DEAD/DEAH box helicase family protein [candidate division TA06 bacterium]|uniref:DEAD/DEAH box helicase family protein n=1 Tax=candidate division TA06 bacterium TaxID=2250710 RepID=A0A933IAN2_UNCT6|nr:DEAD/DEAH box helicase family protein [candidate division TA06 bacterium]
MLSIYQLIAHKTKNWVAQELSNNQSVIGGILKHIENESYLRIPQKEAIEVYLWLKFVGNNQKLSDIVRQGLIYDEETAKGLDNYYTFGNNYVTQFLNQFALENGLDNFQKKLANDPQSVKYDWDQVLEELLHNYEYPNYLYSLPMGAGKTYLIAAFIYLDLFFALLNKTDKRFAHNFVVFAPQAAKTAILPSLQTIKNFEPEWVLPANEAERLKIIVHFEILDSLASKRKDKLHGNNPNLEKVNGITQTKDFGLVFITNAEKVVLEKYEDKDKIITDPASIFYDPKKADEIIKINELREKLSHLPFLGVFLDEVHHTYKASDSDEKKLRNAVNILNQHKKVVSAIGLSGTPYVKNQVIQKDLTIRLNQIQDIVYHYSLADGIGKFLKIPIVNGVKEVKEKAFINEALNEFFKSHDITYYDKTKSKIAFYCPSIKTLNENILPVVQEWYQKNRPGKEEEIFRYYSEVKKEDKIYKLPKESLAIFNNLDKSYSKKRVVLLVAVGAEGWDCRSLTAVALPRLKTTKNFVLQTTCRCLREVKDASKETALIFLEENNYNTLDHELKENYNLSIADLKYKQEPLINVIIKKPKLGKLKYCQVYKKFEIVKKEQKGNPNEQLNNFSFKGIIDKYKYQATTTTATIGRGGLVSESNALYSSDEQWHYEFIDFIYDLTKACYGKYQEKELISSFEKELQEIYRQIKENKAWVINHPHLEIYDIIKIVAGFLMAEYTYKIDVIKEDAEIELLEWNIIDPAIFYGSGKFLPKIKLEDIDKINKRPNRIEEDMEDAGLDSQDISFNYMPYRLDSDYERNALLELLKLSELKDLEVYYNGYKDLKLQNFWIKTDFGEYTPDFLIVKRKEGKKYKSKTEKGEIDEVLIIETKGSTYYNDDFKRKEKFVNETFLAHNPNFKFACFVDEGKNDFKKHLAKVREIINNL